VSAVCLCDAAKDALSEDRISHTTKSGTFVVSSPTPQTSQLPGVVADREKDDDAKRLATPGESKGNNTENVSDNNNTEQEIQYLQLSRVASSMLILFVTEAPTPWGTGGTCPHFQ